MFSRTLRPLTARSASLIQTPTRLLLPLPIRYRSFATSADETTNSPANAPEASLSTSASEASFTSSTQTTDAGIVTPHIPTPAEKATLPYFVSRNNLNNYSVYQRNKSGGNRKLTLVKKTEGDLQALKHDIKDALGLSDQEVSVNSVTKHIVVKGHRREELRHFLRTMGF